MFTDKEHQGPFAFSEELGNLSISSEPAADVILPTANDRDLLLSTSEKEDSRAHGNNFSAYDSSQGALVSLNETEPTHSQPANSAIDDLLGLGFSVTPTPATLKLNAKAVLDPSTFQQKWRQLPVSISQEGSVTPQGVAAMTSPQALVRHMQLHYIHCIASGGQSPNFKFFFFAQKENEPSNFLVECIINSSTCKAQIKIKADDQSVSQDFSTLFQSALSKFGMA